MEYIYIILENSQPYGLAYKTYNKALSAVKDRHAKKLLDLDPNELDIPEDPRGITGMYIEPWTYVYIYKLPLMPLA